MEVAVFVDICLPLWSYPWSNILSFVVVPLWSKSIWIWHSDSPRMYATKNTFVLGHLLDSFLVVSTPLLTLFSSQSYFSLLERSNILGLGFRPNWHGLNSTSWLIGLHNNDLIVLYSRGMRVNLFELHFPSFHFSSQTNKWVFHLSIFLSSQPNTYEKKLNIFYHSTFLSLPHFLSSHFSISPTKQTLNI